MEDLIGVYGILDLDHWPNAPFLLLDGGVEKRWKEPYAFHNTDRGTYSGWLMQYTLSGTGWFEKNGKTYEMRPGRGFLCQIPENSRYYLHPESEEPWIFLYFHFRGSAVSYAAERLFEKTGDVFYADLRPVVGSEQGGVRPVLIIQNDTGNRHSPTVICAAITSRMNKAKLPTHVELHAYTTDMMKDSVILLEQLRTVDKTRLKEKVCHLSHEYLEQVDRALMVSLELDT